ncbi:senescence-associated protein AAF, chlorolplastic-like isoform X2 [Hibiscus syriacus]|uniref:senescence-associated protein AAF, chlorolplastic-like isoform X2 n=1 Tax=Hibiscus syriacus TaxID=106335 RepID=UPI0019206DFA|nr:senescence-associated protein AAF, chlorolplastic-like isoform X2 [Hibiscus syriacus]
MAFTSSKVPSGSVVTKNVGHTRLHSKIYPISQGFERRTLRNTPLLLAKLSFPNERSGSIYEKTGGSAITRGSSMICLSSRTRNSEATESVQSCPDASGAQIAEDEVSHSGMHGIKIHSSQGLAEACRFACNDAKFVNERARNDMVLLSRGIMRLDARARQDVAILGSGFLKLDARAREDTEKIDRSVKKKAERLHHIATILKDKAQSRLKTAADKHWSDGALEFTKNIHDMMVSKVYKFPLRWESSLSANDLMLEKNGKTLDFFNGEVSTNRISAIQEAYWSIASALSEADGIDYTDPEELELLITTLIDLDAMDGKSSVSLLAECSSSPDVSTRQALANALAAAPSMWTLGNAGMGALQRLAEDNNPAIAAAASKAIYELKKQWEIEEGDCWRFMMNLKPSDSTDGEDDGDEN